MVATAKRRTQEERKAESERRILEAAVELFATQGYVKTTLNQVGTRAGYTGGLISSRFGSKENLLRAVLRRISDVFEDRVSRVVDANDARATLRRIVEIYLTDVAKKNSAVRALYAVMGEALGAVGEVQGEVAEFNQLTRERLARIVANGVESGEIPSTVNPDAAAMLILGLIRGVSLQYLADPRRFDVKAVTASINRMIDGYLGG